MADPFKFSLTSPEEARAKCQAYFDSLARTEWVEVYDPDVGGKVAKEIPARSKIPGMAGLAVALGVNRRTLITWIGRAASSDDPNIVAISHVIAQAKAQIEAAQEDALFDREAHRGALFSLQVNYGWGETEEKRPDETFQRQILPPVAGGAGLAVPKWEPEGDE